MLAVPEKKIQQTGVGVGLFRCLQELSVHRIRVNMGGSLAKTGLCQPARRDCCFELSESTRFLCEDHVLRIMSSSPCGKMTRGVVPICGSSAPPIVEDDEGCGAHVF